MHFNLFRTPQVIRFQCVLVYLSVDATTILVIGPQSSFCISVRGIDRLYFNKSLKQRIDL